jgi:WD40 repeat protein
LKSYIAAICLTLGSSTWCPSVACRGDVACEAKPALNPAEQRQSLLARSTVAASIKLETILSEPPGKVLAYNQTAARLLVAGEKSARLFDAATMRPLSGLASFDQPLVTAVISPDGRWMICVKATEVTVWDTETSREARTLKHDGDVIGAEFSADGAWAAIVARGSVAVWKVETWAEHRTYKHSARIYMARFAAPDGSRMLSVAGTVANPVRAHEIAAYVWDVASTRDVLPRTGIECPLVDEPRGRLVRMATVDLAGKRFAVVRFDRVGVFSIRDSKRIGVRALAAPSADIVDLSADGRRLVSGGANSLTMIWDVDTGALLADPVHTRRLHRVSQSADGSRVVLSFPGLAVVWDTVNDTSLLEVKGVDKAEPPVGVCSADGRHVAISFPSLSETSVWTLPPAEPAKPVGD